MPSTTLPDIIIPVILCGGSGTRLWPASRENHPKQFLSLMNDKSLLQNTVTRALRISGAAADHLVIVTLGTMKDEIVRQLSEIDPSAAGHILSEPSARNTAAAVAFAADYIHRTFGENAIMWILPSDHHIAKEDVLFHSFSHALASARDGNLVTFGIKPTRPDIGYGYIRLEASNESSPVRTVQEFVEKPDLEKATAYIACGDYLWNSGMFLFSTSRVLDHYHAHANDILACVREATQSSATAPCAKAYASIPKQPFDKAIMEKSTNITVVPCNPAWSDIGSWESLWTIRDKDTNNNVIDGKAACVNAQRCFIQSDDRLVAVSGINDIVVIDTKDALLIASRNDADAMKNLVNHLKDTGAPEVMDVAIAPQPAQPWTMVKSLSNEKSFNARELTLKPGEHKVFDPQGSDLCLYTVLEGTAMVSIGGDEKTLSAFESMNIQATAPYSISNTGTTTLKMIEVQKAQAEGIFFGKTNTDRKVA